MTQALAATLPPEIASAREADVWRANAQSHTGSLNYHRGNYKPAEDNLRGSIALCERMGDLRGKALTLIPLGGVLSDRGRYADAARYLEEAVRLFEELGDDPLGLAHALYDLGDVERHRGDLAAAARYLERSLELRRHTADRRGIASSLGSLGRIYCDQGMYQLARDKLEESVRIFRELADPSFLGWSLRLLADLHLRRWDFIAAEAALTESLRRYQSVNGAWGLIRALEGLAAIAGMYGLAEFAGRLYGAAEQARGNEIARSGMDQKLYDSLLQLVRALLTDAEVSELDRGWKRGRGESLGGMVDEFLARPQSLMEEVRAMQNLQPVLHTQHIADKRGAKYTFECLHFPNGATHIGSNDRVGPALIDVMSWAAIAFPVYDQAKVEQLVAGKIDNAKHLAFIRDDAGGRVVGFHVYKRIDWPSGYAVPLRVAYIDQMGFDPAVWDRGLATASQAAIFDLLQANVVCASSGNPRLYGSCERLAREHHLDLYPRDGQTPEPVYKLAHRITEELHLTSAELDDRLVRTYQGPTSRGTGRHPILDDVLHLSPHQHVFYLLLKPEVTAAILPPTS